MSIIGDGSSLRFRRIQRSGFADLHSLDLSGAERFLEPLPVILDLVARRPAHWLFGIERGGALAGFYVVHRDRRDGACWWLGWLAVDERFRGLGLGRSALAAVMAGVRRVGGCRRVRLLVAADNAVARRLYEGAGFRAAGVWAETGELVMEWALPGVRAAPADAVVVPALTLVLAMLMRVWRRGMPPCARMSGEHHGPPVLAGRLRAARRGRMVRRVARSRAHVPLRRPHAPAARPHHGGLCRIRGG